MSCFQDSAEGVLLPNLNDLPGILVTVRVNGDVAYILQLRVAREICVIFPVR